MWRGVAGNYQEGWRVADEELGGRGWRRDLAITRGGECPRGLELVLIVVARRGHLGERLEVGEERVPELLALGVASDLHHGVELGVLRAVVVAVSSGRTSALHRAQGGSGRVQLK